MNRRAFLLRSGLALSASVLAEPSPSSLARADGTTSATLSSWEAVRAQFSLTRERIHMAGFLLASHPKPVRDAIEAHRRGLDENPAEYLHNTDRCEAATLRAAADYLGVQPIDIALTDSTTMGLGLLYGGLTLDEGQEILTTTHDHYSTAMSLQLRAQRTGAIVRTIPLYRQAASASQEEIVDTMLKAVRPHTRVVAVTWVHSSTGVKLPIRAMADALAKVNAKRPEAERILLCVDGVHGFGVEDVHMADLGCDFFIAGCHKWLFGPRGTGLVWGHPRAWPRATATIPPFDSDMLQMWTQRLPARVMPMGRVMTPGGFHSFEHRWALGEAFQFHQTIGKSRIAERIHTLNRQLKAGLAEMGHITLHTPQADALSAGIVCFEVKGVSPEQVVARLYEQKIVASVTPYATRYARLAPSVLTSVAEVNTTLRAVENLRTAAA